MRRFSLFVLALPFAFAGPARAQTYADWRSAQFTTAELADPAISGPAADPDGDSIPNLSEFVFVGAPKLNESNLTPTLEVVSGTLALTYRERHGLAESGVRVNLEASDYLTHWVTPNSVVEADREVFADYDLVTLLDPVPLASAATHGRRFLRLRVDASAPSSALQAPTNPNLAALSPTTYELRWNDRNRDETGHLIERLSTSSGSWESIGSSSADTVRWLHTTANYRDGFTYRVAALRSSDNTRATSPAVSLPDTDGDGIPDVFELGASYAGASGTYSSFPDQFSSGGSGVADGWAVANGFDPRTHDFSLDTDGDGLSDAEEAARGTDPRLADTDGDGVPDGEDGWPLFPGLAPAVRPEASYAIIPLAGAPSGSVGRFINNLGHVILQAGGNWYFWDGSAAHALDGRIADIVDFDDQDRWAARLVDAPSPPEGPWAPPDFGTGQGSSDMLVRDIPRWPADILDQWDENAYLLRHYDWFAGDAYLTPAGGLWAVMFFDCGSNSTYRYADYLPTGEYYFNEPVISGNFQWAATSATSSGPLRRHLANYHTYWDAYMRYAGEVFMPAARNELGLVVGVKYGPHDSVLRLWEDQATHVAGDLPKVGPALMTAGTISPLDEPTQLVVPGSSISLDDVKYCRPQWINNHDHIGGATIDGQAVLWLNAEAGLRDDQTVDDSPVYQRYVWKPQYGEAPPRLNKQLEGVGVQFVSGLPPVLRLWQNGRWHPIASRIPATQGPTPSWQISSAGRLNDHGVILANAMKTIDDQGNPIPFAAQVSEPVLLVSMEILAPPAPKTGSAAPRLADTVLAGKPTPEVEITIDDAFIADNGDLAVVVKGTVRDRLSELLADETSRVASVTLAIDGNTTTVNVPLAYAPGEDLHRRVDSTTEFERTLTVQNPKPRGYTIIATTEPNAVGQTGWDKAVVGLGWRASSGSIPDEEKLSLKLTAAPSSGIDTLRAQWGTASVSSTAPLFTETSASSGLYTGTLTVGGESCPAQISVSPVAAIDPAVVDVLEVRLSYTQPSAGRSFERSGLWHETAAASLEFAPDDQMWNGRDLVIHTSEDLPGSHVRDPEPLVLRLGVPPALAEAGAQVRVNGQNYALKQLTVAGQSGVFAVADANATRPRIFLPGQTALPAELAVASASTEGDEIKWELVLPGQSTPLELARTPIVPESDSSAPSPLAAWIDTLPKWVQVGGGGSGGGGSSAPGWHQPGDEVTMEDLKTAYAFIYPDQYSTILLREYLALGEQGYPYAIHLENVLGDARLSHIPSNYEIYLEYNDDDINPAIAAQYLFNCLSEACSISPRLRTAVTNACATEGILESAITTWRANAIAAAGKHCAAAAELYLSGIGIVNEGADWVLVINDLTEGHYEALAAALPFVPVAIMKATRIERAGTREVLQTALSAEKIATLQTLHRIEDLSERLRVYGTVVDSGQLKDTLAKVLTGPGGAIKIGKREELRRRMLKLTGLARNPLLTHAHHDLPYELVERFAEIGMDINDPAFGRWVKVTDHERWHKYMTPKYNDFWKAWFDQFGTSLPTRQQVLDQLIEARNHYRPE